MAGQRRSVPQTAQAILRRDVRSGLVEAVTQTGPGGFGSVLFRATAAVYAVLAEHAPDRRGRCERCRRPGSWVGSARRRCRVYPLVLEWLQLPVTCWPPACAATWDCRSHLLRRIRLPRARG